MTTTTTDQTVAGPAPMSTEPNIPIGEVLDTLRKLMNGEESPPSRVAAAKILLERIAPKEDDERHRREAEERAAAVAEARCLMAEFTAAKSLGLYEPLALVENRAREPDHATE